MLLDDFIFYSLKRKAMVKLCVAYAMMSHATVENYALRTFELRHEL